MKVLVACEFSGVVREAFKSQGHDAWSCDLLPTERPGNHIQGDAIDAAYLGQWDLMIAHPPCTYIGVMSNCRINEPGRKELREQGMQFFLDLAGAPIQQIALENPRGLPEKRYRKPDQIIQPWQFGHPVFKATCLWLKGLPYLSPTHCTEPQRKWDGKRWRTWVDGLPGGKSGWKKRSITFQGIADAMSQQWGGDPAFT